MVSTATMTQQSNRWQGMDFKLEEIGSGNMDSGMEEISGSGTDIGSTQIVLGVGLRRRRQLHWRHCINDPIAVGQEVNADRVPRERGDTCRMGRVEKRGRPLSKCQPRTTQLRRPRTTTAGDAMATDDGDDVLQASRRIVACTRCINQSGGRRNATIN